MGRAGNFDICTFCTVYSLNFIHALYRALKIIALSNIPVGGLLEGLVVLSASISIIQLVVIILLIVYILYSRHKYKVYTHRLLYTQY